ncbi:MAG TPA: M48 family metallopeptidase [Rhizomicrobium sp.]|nr:M48 family metallopeptidase [Rhizomicrobium sp.]
MSVEGRYFYPHSARFVAARCTRPQKRLLRFESVQGEALGEFRARKVRISERLGNIPRRFRLPDGAMFETVDNDGADEMLRGTGRGPGAIDRVERSWKWVLVSVAVTLGATYGFVTFGIPALASALAAATPDDIVVEISHKSLQSIDGSLLKPSRLDAGDKARAERAFARLLRLEPDPGRFHLLFRSAPAMGPNAFAMPDGEIVVTDEIFPLVKSDTEIEGVFAHEMSHVNHRHGLQRIYQASLVPAAIAVATGDASQLGHMTALVPGVLLQSAYSRAFEQQADDDAAEMLRRDGQNPGALADLLQRMDEKVCGKAGCRPSWIASHPATGERVEKLRAAGKQHK